MEGVEDIKRVLKMMDEDVMDVRRAFLVRRIYELSLLACQNGPNGLLPGVEACARALKISRKAMAKTLHKLNRFDLVHETPQGWVVNSLQARPAAPDRREPIRYARQRHSPQAQSAAQGGNAPKQAIPYFD